jgi:hypothetical protein
MKPNTKATDQETAKDFFTIFEAIKENRPRTKPKAAPNNGPLNNIINLG